MIHLVVMLNMTMCLCVCICACMCVCVCVYAYVCGNRRQQKSKKKKLTGSKRRGVKSESRGSAKRRRVEDEFDAVGGFAVMPVERFMSAEETAPLHCTKGAGKWWELNPLPEGKKWQVRHRYCHCYF